jgi:AP-1 complex subunit gamma-1
MILGATHTSKNGTDVLLDLLSIGSPSAPIESPPAQSNSSIINMLSPSTSKREPISSLDDLSSVSLSSRASSTAGAASMTDLLDVFASGPSASGKLCLANAK